MAHCTRTGLSCQIEAYRQRLAEAPELALSEVLKRENVERVLKEENVGFRQRLFTPLVTVWVFVLQVLSRDSSCRAAVTRLIVYLVARGQRPCAPYTGSYCKARGRLPERVIARLAREAGRQLSQQAVQRWRWKGRTVKLVDGSTVSMPDTPANQAQYPQLAQQKAGLGFPLARIVCVFSLACGSALEMAMGRCKGKETGETALFRQLWGSLEGADVVLGDRFYSSYFMIAGLEERAVDYVGRQHQRRKTDFRQGRRLGRQDHRVVWSKPARPAWLDEQTYAQLPDFLTVRELRVQVPRKGFRTEVLLVVTTLLDPEEFTPADLAELYRQRWHAELDLRSLKISLGMDVLRGKTPEMVRKELWMHLLAYNLIRTVMASAAVAYGLHPRTLSFTGALQAIEAFRDAFVFTGPCHAALLLTALFRTLVAHRVGNRPGRVEPRAIKRRPKPHDLLTMPRKQARELLVQGKAA
jgi:hypothetical protein